MMFSHVPFVLNHSQEPPSLHKLTEMCNTVEKSLAGRLDVLKEWQEMVRVYLCLFVCLGDSTCTWSVFLVCVLGGRGRGRGY